MSARGSFVPDSYAETVGREVPARLASSSCVRCARSRASEISSAATPSGIVPSAYRRDACVQDLLAEQTRRTPQAIAVEWDGGQLTYAELNGRANQLARVAFAATESAGG